MGSRRSTTERGQDVNLSLQVSAGYLLLQFLATCPSQLLQDACCHHCSLLSLSRVRRWQQQAMTLSDWGSTSLSLAVACTSRQQKAAAAAAASCHLYQAFQALQQQMAVTATQHSSSSCAGAQQQQETVYLLCSIELGSTPNKQHQSRLVRE